MRSPVTWYGGKGHLWRRIAPHLPRAGVACYVEPFGGGASILLNRALAGWQRIELNAHCYASTAGRTRDNRNGQHAPRTDVLWLNRAAARAASRPVELTLFEIGEERKCE